MHAVILAGGKGVRLRPYTTALPKPLVPIGDDHVIVEIVLEQLAAQGFRSVTLAINHLGRLIRAYVGDGSRWGLKVDYAEETRPLSTVGPLFALRHQLPEHFVMLNGDLLTNLRFDDLLRHHVATGAPLTVATSVQEQRSEFGVLDIEAGSIKGFREKPVVVHHVSMGVYGVSRDTLAPYPVNVACGVDTLILDLLKSGRPPASYAFDGLWMDIGRPEDYDIANATFDVYAQTLLPQRVAPPETLLLDRQVIAL